MSNAVTTPTTETSVESTDPETAAAEVRKPRTRRGAAGLLCLVSLCLLAGGTVWSVSIGPTPVGIGAIVAAVFTGGHSINAVIVHSIRLPRVALGALVGGNSAVGGVIMQSITGNPLGAPEILGVNAGAAVVAVLSITFVPSLAGVSTIILAFAGAAIAGVVVMSMAGIGRGRTDPVRIALAGVTLTALLASVTQSLIIFSDKNGENAVFHWIVGGVNSATWSDVRTVLPWTAVGLVGAFALAGRLNLLGLGEDLARGLGAHVGQIRVLGAALVVVLAGASVAVAGPITFVGLIIPHIVRRLAGSNHYVVIPLSALLGADLLLFADIASRYVDPPSEVPSGVVTALVGAPFFIYLARKAKVAS